MSHTPAHPADPNQANPPSEKSVNVNTPETSEGPIQVVRLSDPPSETAPAFFSLSERVGRIRYLTYILIGMVACSLSLIGIYLFCLILPPALAMLVSQVSLILIKNVVMPMIVFVMTIRRLHDINANGWWSLLVIIPFLTVILLLVPGTSGSNRFGAEPKANSPAIKAAAIILPLSLFFLFFALYKKEGSRTQDNVQNNQPVLRSYPQ